MKRFSIFFAFLLITSMPFAAIAADMGVDHHEYKAELSGAKIPPVVTKATGEATFELIGKGTGGGGTGGGIGDTDQPGIEQPGNEGMQQSGVGESGAGGAGTTGSKSYKGVLGRDMSDSGVGAGGAGMGEVLRYTLSVKDIENVTAAHLHMGKRTETGGPVIAPLFLGPKKTGEFTGVLGEGTITDKDLTGPLSGKKISDLVKLMDAGEVYVNVHTEKHPAGEIRGEVKAE